MTIIAYLDLIIITDNIGMDYKEVKAVQKWRTPTCIKDVQTFIRFADFYQQFFNWLFKLLAPMIIVIRKSKSFSLIKNC